MEFSFIVYKIALSLLKCRIRDFAIEGSTICTVDNYLLSENGLVVFRESRLLQLVECNSFSA